MHKKNFIPEKLNFLFKFRVTVLKIFGRVAIVAKCEEIINLAQKILIWRQLLAKEKSQVNFFCLASESSPPCLVPLNGHQCVS